MEGAGAREALLMPAFVITVIAQESCRAPLREIPAQGFSFGVGGSPPGVRAKGAFHSKYGGVNPAAMQQKVLDKSCVL